MAKDMVILNKPLHTITQLLPFILNRNINSFRKAAILMIELSYFLQKSTAPH